MGKATCPFFQSLPASLRKKPPSKSGWMVGRMYVPKNNNNNNKKPKLRHLNARTFLSKFNLWKKEGTTFACHPQLCTFQAGQASKSTSISGTSLHPLQSSLCPLLTASAHNIQAGAQPLPAWFPLLQREVAQATPVAPPPESPVVHDRVQPVKAASQPLPPNTARPKARDQASSCDRQKCAQADIRVPRRCSRVRATATLGYQEAPQRLRARRPPSAARGRCTPRPASCPLAAPSQGSAPPRPRVSLAPTSWCPARLLFHATRLYPRRPGELTFAAGTIHRGSPGARHGVAM